MPLYKFDWCRYIEAGIERSVKLIVSSRSHGACVSSSALLVETVAVAKRHLRSAATVRRAKAHKHILGA